MGCWQSCAEGRRIISLLLLKLSDNAENRVQQHTRSQGDALRSLPEVVPTKSVLGAEIRELDVSAPMSERVGATVHNALLKHGVICVRGQEIDEQAQVEFSRLFGMPARHVREQPDRPVPEIFVISNVCEDGQPIGALGNAEIEFHSDLSYLRHPGTISTLYAVEVPKRGGNTEWACCKTAYNALDEATRMMLRSLHAVHRHHREQQNPSEPVAHPVISVHPETGQPGLYVSPHFTRRILGLHEHDSNALLKRLFRHATDPSFVWTHHWQVGDLVVWDNRCTMHRRLPFPNSERRVMKRTQIFNDNWEPSA